MASGGPPPEAMHRPPRLTLVLVPYDSGLRGVRSGAGPGRLAREVRVPVESSRIPVNLAGKCDTAIGTVSGLGSGIGVAWFDAHGDFNMPETTANGFLDGTGPAEWFTGAEQPGEVATFQEPGTPMKIRMTIDGTEATATLERAE